jgi:uncharacterized membrane protein YkvA (DUF1232 family)
MSKNVFFDMALNQASRILGRKKRLVMLIARLGTKLRDVKWSEIKGENVKEKFFVIGRLIKAYSLGQYRQIPWKPLLLITAAVIYFISPLDLIPDVIPGLGFTDDVGILLTVYNSIHGELEKFLTWEKSQVTES